MSDAGARIPPPESCEHRDLILQQLDEILASRLFKHSKRCGPLLRHVVTETLNGRAEHLKERAIGADVFGRRLAYDTTADPIVRTTASEVRKRIAQYYHEFGHTATVWIDLTSGSYVPEFRILEKGALPQPHSSPVQSLAVFGQAEAPLHQSETGPARGNSRPPRIWLAAALVIPVLAVAFWIWAGSAPQRHDPVDRFWAPLLQAESPIIAMGGGSSAETEPAQQATPQTAMDALNADRVGFSDAAALAEVVGLFRARGRNIVIRRAATLPLEEMRRAPVILVGANNPWTTRLLAPLRFYIQYGVAAPFIALRDHQKPTEMIFSVDLSAVAVARHTEEYAIISRIVDRLTEQPVIMLSGLGKEGTSAASEFVTQPRYLLAFEQKAPRDWDKRNLQIVIATDVIRGNSGPPRIVATHVW